MDWFLYDRDLRHERVIFWLYRPKYILVSVITGVYTPLSNIYKSPLPRLDMVRNTPLMLPEEDEQVVSAVKREKWLPKATKTSHNKRF